MRNCLLSWIFFWIVLLGVSHSFGQIPDSSRVSLVIQADSSFPTASLQFEIENKLSHKFTLMACPEKSLVKLREFLLSYPSSATTLRQALNCKAEYVIYISKLEYHIYGEKGARLARNHVISGHVRVFSVDDGELVQFEPIDGNEVSRTERCPQCQSKAISDFARKVRNHLNVGWKGLAPEFGFSVGIYQQGFFEMRHNPGDAMAEGLMISAGPALHWKYGGAGAELGWTRNGIKNDPTSSDSLFHALHMQIFGFAGYPYSWNAFDEALFGGIVGYRISSYQLSWNTSSGNTTFELKPASSLILGIISEVRLVDSPVKFLPRVLWVTDLYPAKYTPSDFRKIQDWRNSTNQPRLFTDPGSKFAGWEVGLMMRIDL